MHESAAAVASGEGEVAVGGNEFGDADGTVHMEESMQVIAEVDDGDH